ncbi:acid phosphatase [Saccharibacter sp. 17.LH.SD]|uniref:HAD family acid phosphatase n=1 Tax=Saccharibacter sp. 17.LH.SD TaxID=2689393 RepID=UPI001368A3AC|nr:HAD family acid phosphatase [Saccharibacter sp. 17.LH.SD]MXV44191.1 acid phosphatase [Saccharibacter sp. 17.LH.SD]
MKRFFRFSLTLFFLEVGTLSHAVAEAPANVGKAIIAAEAYHDSGDYQRDFDAIIAQARSVLDKEAPRLKKPAIILDIDETTLSNWPAMRADRLGDIDGPCDQLPKGPCGMNAWIQRGEGPVFEATRALYQDAQAHHLAVFFVTGRSEDERGVTERNLTRAGLSSWKRLYMRPVGDHRRAEDYKTPIRSAIEKQGYTILLNIGDQESDLMGGHSLHAYQVPNPFYYIP